jgi:hypothetical protein
VKWIGSLNGSGSVQFADALCSKLERDIQERWSPHAGLTSQTRIQGWRMAKRPPKEDVRQPGPGEDLARPPHRIEDPDELVDEAVDESFPASDPPSFTPTKAGPPTKPDLPSTGLPSDAPGG